VGADGQIAQNPALPIGVNPAVPAVTPPVAAATFPAAGNAGNAPALTLSPLFKMVFISVLGLTILCLLLSVYISIHLDSGAKNVEAMKSLNEKLLSVFTLGCGAIIGLLGGKTLN